MVVGSLLGLSLLGGMLSGILPNLSAVPAAPPAVSALSGADLPGFEDLSKASAQSSSPSLSAPGAGAENVADPRAGAFPNARAENAPNANSAPSADNAVSPNPNSQPNTEQAAYQPPPPGSGGSASSLSDMPNMACTGGGGLIFHHSVLAPVLSLRGQGEFCAAYHTLVEQAKEGSLPLPSENEVGSGIYLYHPAYITAYRDVGRDIGVSSVELVQYLQSKEGWSNLFLSYGQGTCFEGNDYPLSLPAARVFWYLLHNTPLFANMAILPQQHISVMPLGARTPVIVGDMPLLDYMGAYEALYDMYEDKIYPALVQSLQDISVKSALDSRYIFVSVPDVFSYKGRFNANMRGIGFIAPSTFKVEIKAVLPNSAEYNFSFPPLPPVNNYAGPHLMFFALDFPGEVNWEVRMHGPVDSRVFRISVG